jgi:hypothetical protein
VTSVREKVESAGDINLCRYSEVPYAMYRLQIRDPEYSALPAKKKKKKQASFPIAIDEPVEHSTGSQHLTTGREM